MFVQRKWDHLKIQCTITTLNMKTFKCSLVFFFLSSLQFRGKYEIEKIQHPSEITITVINQKHPDIRYSVSTPIFVSFIWIANLASIQFWMKKKKKIKELSFNSVNDWLKELWMIIIIHNCHAAYGQKLANIRHAYGIRHRMVNRFHAINCYDAFKDVRHRFWSH